MLLKCLLNVHKNILIVGGTNPKAQINEIVESRTCCIIKWLIIPIKTRKLYQISLLRDKFCGKSLRLWTHWPGCLRMNLNTLIAVVSLCLWLQTGQEHFYLYPQACNHGQYIQRRASLKRCLYGDKCVDLDNQLKWNHFSYSGAVVCGTQTQILRFSAMQASPDVALAFACCRLVHFKLNALGM